MQHPTHKQAKASQNLWLNGYRVIISEVIHTYGDDQFPHPTATQHTPPTTDDPSMCAD